MIFHMSYEDLQELPEFSNLLIKELIDKKYDNRIKEILYEFGLDKNKEFSVQACTHFTLRGKKTLNFRLVGFERSDVEWVNSSSCSLEKRINRHKDVTLIGELSAMGDMFRESRDNVAAICSAAEAKARKDRRKDFIIPLDYVEEMQETIETIKALQHLQKHVRGELLSDEDVLFDLRSSDERLQMDDEQHDKLNPEYKEWAAQQVVQQENNKDNE